MKTEISSRPGACLRGLVAIAHYRPGDVRSASSSHLVRFVHVLSPSCYCRSRLPGSRLYGGPILLPPPRTATTKVYTAGSRAKKSLKSSLSVSPFLVMLSPILLSVQVLPCAPLLRLADQPGGLMSTLSAEFRRRGSVDSASAIPTAVADQIGQHGRARPNQAGVTAGGVGLTEDAQ